MKQLYLNIFFQLIAVTLVIRILFFEETNFNTLNFFYSKNLVIIFSLALLAKVILTILFYSLLNLITTKKNNYYDVSSYFLQGGVINQLLPGVGFIYKYYKLKLSSSINLAEFTIAQGLFSLSVFTSYMFLAIIFGFIAIASSLIITFMTALILLIFLVVVLSIRFKLYKYIISKLLKINKISNFINDLKIVKQLLKSKFSFILITFLGFLILANLMSFNFYILLNIFESKISFLTTSYVWVSSSITSIISLINFFGLFEFIITVSSSIMVPDLNDIFIFALVFRFINITSTFTLIFLFSLRFIPINIIALLNSKK